MGNWAIIVNRWPGRELEIRRLCASDPSFASLVDDYREARTALDHWRAVDPPSSSRITDYETLVIELGAEIDTGLVRP